MIRLVAKKRKSPGEADTVTVLHGERVRVFKAWNQAVLPHELVHFAVEAALGMRGFVRLVAAGADPDELGKTRDPETLFAEGLTNAFQYEIWGLVEVSNAGVLERVNEGAERGRVPRLEIDEARLDAVRELLGDLSRRWSALPHGGKLELSLPAEVGDPSASVPQPRASHTARVTEA